MALLPPARPRCDDDSPWIKSSWLFSWSNRSRVASVGELHKCHKQQLYLTQSHYWIRLVTCLPPTAARNKTGHSNSDENLLFYSEYNRSNVSEIKITLNYVVRNDNACILFNNLIEYSVHKLPLFPHNFHSQVNLTIINSKFDPANKTFLSWTTAVFVFLPFTN
jgi:hypothetical protein